MGRSPWWIALALTGCGTCDPLDPAAALAEHAGPGASACGEGDRDTPVPPIRACVLDAQARGAAFHATVAGEVADGSHVTGYASDGTPDGLVHLRYTSSFGQYGGVSEDITWYRCAHLLDRGAACDALHRDLCLLCDWPRRIPDPREE